MNHKVLLTAAGFGELYLDCKCGWTMFFGGSVLPEFALRVTDYHYRHPDEPASTVETNA